MFYAEVVVFSMFISSYMMYMLLSAVTDWEGVGAYIIALL